MDPRTRRLLEAPIGTTLLHLAMPNVIVMVVQTMIGLIETYFVAKLGVDALAAMALVFPAYMLLVMVSAGAMGGGILSAIARALGAGDEARTNLLVWHAIGITVLFSAVTMAAAWTWGPGLYALMGGRGASLRDAVLYSNIIFGAAIPLWLFNSMAAMIRATGNTLLPAAVISIGAVVLIPVSPLLIFGIGPFPALGIAGGAVAVAVYYVIGGAVFAFYLWSGRGVLKPSLMPARLRWQPMKEILRVGIASSAISLSTNVTAVVATGLAGVLGPAAVAGYGTGVRLEYLLVPLVFGLGQPVGAMVGTAIGAGRRDRAIRVAWIGAAIAGGLTEAIGLTAASFPTAWLTLFGGETQMIDVGSEYLRLVGPFYGFFGAGLALYFAAQGAGKLQWPMIAAVTRVLISAGGGVIAVHLRH
ncbi:MAG TPA: MATE family efflux transporter, partial [Pseudolabrys sp.]|nr:MATE family efflux transporter [Pseudolabrys sp.]